MNRKLVSCVLLTAVELGACSSKRPEFGDSGSLESTEPSSSPTIDGGQTSSPWTDNTRVVTTLSDTSNTVSGSSTTVVGAMEDAGSGATQVAPGSQLDASDDPNEAEDDSSVGDAPDSEPSLADASPNCIDECELDVVTCEHGAPQVCTTGDDGCLAWQAHPDCNTCEAPSRVAPRSPMRGAYTGSLHAPSARQTLRPLLVWNESGGGCGEIVYHLQLDDSCSPGELPNCPFESPEVDTRTPQTEFRPSETLPVSVEVPVGAIYAWRVRACVVNDACSEWSDIAYLHVGRTEQDFNGDGYADIVLAGALENFTSVLEVYEGGPVINRTRDARVELEYPLAKPPRFVGDVNADGFADLVIAENATELCSSSGMNVGVVYGAQDNTGVTSDHLCRTQGTPSVMLGFAHSGDLDADGFADIVVAHDLSSSENRVYVLRGGVPLPTTPTADIDVTIGAPYPHTETAGVAMAGAGDFNGDSYADMVLSASRVSEEFLVGRLYLGGSSIPEDFADEQEYQGCNINVWNALLGDVNDDGNDDWGLTCSGAAGSQFGVIRGGAALPASKSNVFETESQLRAVSEAFDFDDDGELESFIGRSEEQSLIWRPDGFTPSSPETFSDASDQVALAIADHDGDGRKDMASFSSTQSTSWTGSYSSFNVTPVYLAPEEDVTINHMVF